MSGSINWNNYTPTQIMQLQNSGVKVPPDVLQKANDSSSVDVQLGDDVVREDIELEIEDFTNSEEFSGAELKDQISKLGSAQSEKYKAALEASRAADEIAETMYTIDQAVTDQTYALKDASDSGDDKAYQEGVKNLQKLSKSSSSKAGVAKDLYNKAEAADAFAEKTHEKFKEWSGGKTAWRAVAGVLTGGLSEAVFAPMVHSKDCQNDERKTMESIDERSGEIQAEAPKMQDKSNTILQKIKNTSLTVDDQVNNS